MPHSLCGWLWHMHLAPTAFHLRWCRSVSQHVVRGSPHGPHMVGGLCCRLPPSCHSSRDQWPPRAWQQGPPHHQGTSTLVLPILGLLGIPGPLVAKIKEGKFFDLGYLFPEALEWAFEHSTEKSKKKHFPVTSIADWTLSFTTFVAVAVDFSPHRAVPWPHAWFSLLSLL